jgi:hypothetical protein
MVSVLVRFSTGFPRVGGFPADQFAPSWWKETAGGEERLLRWTEQQFGPFRGVLLLFGGGCSGESCSSSIRISAEKRISQRANCLVFAPAVFEIRRAPKETVFLLRRYSIHAEHHGGVTALWEILLLEKIQG